MNAFSWFTRRGRPTLSDAQQQRRDALPAPQALDDRPLAAQRFVVLDLETSGLDMSRDLVLSIGAVSIEDGAIHLGRGFEATLYRDAGASPAVLIHGIAPSVSAAGLAPAEALLDFMDYLGDSPVLAFHAPFDQRMLARALRQDLGLRLRHPFLDIAELAPLLCPDACIRNGGLDSWADYFGLQVQQRHHASADALATAEMALILFAHARRQGLDSPAALSAALARQQRRQQQPGF